MKWKNTKTIAHLIIVIVLGSITMSYAAATVDWNVLNTMQLEAAPMNVAVSRMENESLCSPNRGKSSSTRQGVH
jgi:predicted lysophospholipase L1 biosynthesis ABC-type transport system permease subunit